jgi:hypothetical protein
MEAAHVAKRSGAAGSRRPMHVARTGVSLSRAREQKKGPPRGPRRGHARGGRSRREAVTVRTQRLSVSSVA